MTSAGENDSCDSVAFAERVVSSFIAFIVSFPNMYVHTCQPPESTGATARKTCARASALGRDPLNTFVARELWKVVACVSSQTEVHDGARAELMLPSFQQHIPCFPVTLVRSHLRVPERLPL